MKNKYFSFVALAAAALATSCASDDLAEQKQEQTDTRTVTLTASVNEGQTRVGMTKNDSKASFYWHKGDAISVLTTTGSFVKFTTEDETGKASATFTGEVTGTISKYAVYPYNESNAVSNNRFACNLSDSYTYTSVGSNIFSKDDSYPSNHTNMPMLGKISDGKITFTCLGGLAVIRIDQMPAESGTLTVTADQQLSGAFYVNWSNPAVIATTSTETEANKTVTFTFSGASTTGAGVFYLPLATGSYTNLTIKISDSNGENTQTIPYGSLTVERANVTAIPLSTDSKGNLRHIVDNGNGSYTINGHKFVDLGLSVLWAETNIGAETACDDGNYYAWGETSPKDSYTTENYTYMNNLTTLDAAHDAATANWGSAIRMPTMTEHGELLDGCSWEWEDMTNSANETIRCYKGVNKNNSDIVIYLPASGSSYDGYNQYDRNMFGYYWSITPDETDKAYARAFEIYDCGYPNSSSYAKCHEGCSIRAVAEKPTTTE